jgi:hypothetical protein
MAISRRIINFLLFIFQLRAGDGVDSGLVQIQTANELLLKHKKLIVCSSTFAPIGNILALRLFIAISTTSSVCNKKPP